MQSSRVDFPKRQDTTKGSANSSAHQMPRVLFVGSEESVKNHWLQSASGAFSKVREAKSGAAALEMLLEEACELILIAPKLPDLDVGEFEGMVRSALPGVQTIRLEIQPAHSPLSSVTTKAPFDPFGAQSRLTLRLGGLALPPGAVPLEAGRWHELIGGSEAMQNVYHSAQLVARKDTTVLVQGESGTGKDLVARGIHAAGIRANQPFVVINCAAIPEALLEAELFGYTKGAFTGASQSRIGRVHAAHGGTLFLDEIGDMPFPLQSKILRFLEQGEVQRIGGTDTLKVDCRVIAATNVDLRQSIESRQFREDLYYRLAVFPIRLPPLRDRLEDLDQLIDHFVKRFCPGFSCSRAARDRLRQHRWPGNVRELRNVLERASLFAEYRQSIEEQDVVF